MFRQILRSFIFVTMLIVLLSGCGEKEKTLVSEASISTAAASGTGILQEGMPSQSKKVLLYDCRNKKSTVVLSTKGGNWSTCWSEDSKYFIIFDIEAQSNRLHIYKSSNVLEEDLPKDLLDISSKIDWVAWIDRENILIDGKGDPSESYLFNIKNKKLEIMSDDTKSYYYSKIYERQKQTTELLSISPYPDIGENFFEGQYSKDKKKILYNSNKYETYLFDTQTKTKKYLFNGFGLQWSPNETKIKYYIPKQKYKSINPKHYAEGLKLETYVYDSKNGGSFKLSDSCVGAEFSIDDTYILFAGDDFYGAGYEIENNDLAQ